MNKNYKEKTWSISKDWSVHWWRDWYEGRWHDSVELRFYQAGRVTVIPVLRPIKATNYGPSVSIDPMPKVPTAKEIKEIYYDYQSRRAAFVMPSNEKFGHV